MTKNIFLPLESLRGFAALSVALFHFNVGSSFNTSFTNNAGIMVDFFFVLSGFVIALNYTGKIKNTSDLIHFQKKRFWRLYPLHIMMLLVFVALEFLKYFLTTKYDIKSVEPAFEKNNLSAFFANVLLIHDWVMPTKTFNAPSWSISAEFFTYAIFAGLLVFTHGKKKLQIYALLGAIFVFGLCLSVSGSSSEGAYGPLRCLYSFSVGALCYCFFEKFRSEVLINSSIPAILLLGATILIVSAKQHVVFEIIPVIFGIAILVLVFTNQEKSVYRVLSNKFLVYLGTISYGIYMIHVFVWQTIIRIQKFVLGVPSSVDSSGVSTVVYENVYIADLVTLLGISVTVFLAHVSYKYFETRFTGQR